MDLFVFDDRSHSHMKSHFINNNFSPIKWLFLPALKMTVDFWRLQFVLKTQLHHINRDSLCEDVLPWNVRPFSGYNDQNVPEFYSVYIRNGRTWCRVLRWLKNLITPRQITLWCLRLLTTELTIHAVVVSVFIFFFFLVCALFRQHFD